MFKVLSKLGVGPKIIFTVSVILGLLFIAEITISKTIILNGFFDIEKQDMQGDIQRVQGLLNDRINNYSVKLSDWTVWDDSYNFIKDGNQKFIDTNLQNSSLTSININFIFFISSSSGIVYGKGVDNRGNEIQIPKDLKELLSKPNSITVHKTPDGSTKGIIKLSEGFLLFASKPSLTSNSEGPIVGTILFGKYLDVDLLSYLAHLNGSKIDFQDYSSKVTETDYVHAKNALTPENRYFVQAVSANEIAGFTIVNDFENKPAFILEDELPRPFYVQGNSTVNFFMMLYFLGSAFGLVIGLFAINKFIVSKITKLNKDVNNIKDQNNLTHKLEVKGNDEFTSVTLSINNLLDQISKKEEEYKKQSEELRLKVEDLEKFQNLTVGRELKMVELKKRLADLEGNAPKAEQEEVNNG